MAFALLLHLEKKNGPNSVDEREREMSNHAGVPSTDFGLGLTRTSGPEKRRAMLLTFWNTT